DVPHTSRLPYKSHIRSDQLVDGYHLAVSLTRSRVGLDIALLEEKGDLLLHFEENPFRFVAKRAVGFCVKDQLRSGHPRDLGKAASKGNARRCRAAPRRSLSPCFRDGGRRPPRRERRRPKRCRPRALLPWQGAGRR